MISSVWRVASRGGAIGAAVLLLLPSCRGSSTTDAALRTARDQLDRIHATDLGREVGRGSYGSAGVSGSRPTAFVAVAVDDQPDSLMTTISDRMQHAGFAPFVPCRPPATCTWRRKVQNKLVTANAVVLTAGQPWGEKSTAHGTVASNSSILQVSMTVGG